MNTFPTHLHSLDLKLHVVFPYGLAVLAFLPAVAVAAVPDAVPVVQQHGATGRTLQHLTALPLPMSGERQQHTRYLLKQDMVKHCDSLSRDPVLFLSGASLSLSNPAQCQQNTCNLLKEADVEIFRHGTTVLFLSCTAKRTIITTQHALRRAAAH